MYLTTPIYYVNDVPHLGHAYATVVADALVRWQRQRGRPARLVTGTDEHGAKIARAAAAAGVAPAAFVETTAARFRSTWDRLGIQYDEFVRTTSTAHRAVVTELLQRGYDRGFIEPGRYDGRYCVACEAYVSEVVCPVHRRPTEHLTEENYFFRLSAFAGPLGDWLSAPGVVRPAVRRNEALGWLRAGLTDFSISRSSLDWGIPLPWDPSHVAYVWFDALAAYLTGAGGAWPGEHLIGKDILRFHAIYWPAILLAADLPLPTRITVYGSCWPAARRSPSPGYAACRSTSSSPASASTPCDTTCSGRTRSDRTASSRWPRSPRGTTPISPTRWGTWCPGSVPWSSRAVPEWGRRPARRSTGCWATALPHSGSARSSARRPSPGRPRRSRDGSERPM